MSLTLAAGLNAQASATLVEFVVDDRRPPAFGALEGVVVAAGGSGGAVGVTGWGLPDNAYLIIPHIIDPCCLSAMASHDVNPKP
jgi:hypothetical protein